VQTQAATAAGVLFSKDRFDIDLGAQSATCPAGISAPIRPDRSGDGSGIAYFGQAGLHRMPATRPVDPSPDRGRSAEQARGGSSVEGKKFVRTRQPGVRTDRQTTQARGRLAARLVGFGAREGLVAHQGSRYLTTTSCSGTTCMLPSSSTLRTRQRTTWPSGSVTRI
jgi:hypothetical protein